MESDDLTVRILIEIRDEIRTTNVRVDDLGRRIDGVREDLGRRIDGVRDDLGRRIDGIGLRIEEVDHENGKRLLESEVRTATRIAEQIAAARDLYALLKDRFELRDRVERCERDIDELKHRAG